MFINNLPVEVLYDLCKYLSLIDIINLSKTCKQFNVLIDKDDYFWMVLIKNHFGFKLYKRYTDEIFNNKKNSAYVLYQTNEDNKKFVRSFRNEKQFYLCGTWLYNMLDGNENSNGYLSYRRVKKRKLSPRTNELKMSLPIEEFFEYYLKRNQYLNNENILQISFYKLIYFYLIESKRLFAVDLYQIRLSCSYNHLYCTNQLHPRQEFDLTSSTGRCVRLCNDRSCVSLGGIKGKFHSILPGIYEIVCRIKLDKNEKYLASYNERCNKNLLAEKAVRYHFYALADYGDDCECEEKQMNFDWYEANYLLYGNQTWFNQIMGKIKVFELSDIYFGFRVRYDLCYRNILFDYIQLNIVG